MTRIETLNLLLCLSGFSVAFFIGVRMRSETEAHIVGSFATLGAGLLGTAVAFVRPGDWQAACDTLLYGGALAMMIGSRKNPHWVAPRWIRPITVSVLLAVWGAFLMGVS